MLYCFFWVIPLCLNFVPTFRNTLFHLHRWCLPAYTAYKGGGSVFRNVGTKHLRRRGFTKNKEYKKPAFIGMFFKYCRFVGKFMCVRSTNVFHQTSAKVEVVIQNCLHCKCQGVK
jgi:hypothetical protein